MRLSPAMLRAAALVAALHALPGDARADDARDCETGKGRDPIAACTRAIAAGKAEGRALARLYYFRGLVHDERGASDAALKDYEQSIATSPTVVGPLVNRALILADRGQYEAAIAELDRAVALDATFPLPHFNRGSTFHDMGEQARAVVDFTAALDLLAKNPDPGNPRAGEIYNARGEAYRESRHYFEAMRDFDRALALRGSDAAALVNRGITHRLMGNATAAKRDFARAAALGKGAEREDRALALYHLGAFERALKELDAALKAAPREPRALYFRGKVRLKSGDGAGGSADIAAALAINPRLARALDVYFAD